MGKYFGTDGVRGIANAELTPELAFQLGLCGGHVLTAGRDKRAKVLIGRDTRTSGQMLESALIAGLLSVGIEAMRLGVVSTPCVAYLTRILEAEAGIMISASHNPFEDNGIKFFGPDGFKLSDEQERAIEELLESGGAGIERPTGAGVGTVSDYLQSSQKYLSYLQQTVDEDFTGLHVALDCANGANSSLATHAFADLEADISTMATSPNGVNINDGVGSTHPEALAAFVLEKGADIGLAFDGDGDRLIAVDETGAIVDGDRILYICAKHLSETGRLNKRTVVSTVMSNMGLYKALEARGIESVQTAVGDRYVVEEMRKNGYNFGGEQSGHIVFLDYNTTGDGLLSGLQLVGIMKATGKKLSELAGEMQVYPQALVNVRVTDKHGVTDNAQVAAAIANIEQQLDGKGRVLVRPSGTEPLVRIMVEAETTEQSERYAQELAELVRSQMGAANA